MRDIRALADEIIRREGGFVDDPDDPGGATKFGVTVHTLRRLGLDLTGDGSVDAQDVRRLTQDDAREIFVGEYFHRPRIDALPVSLQASVFDMHVNSGVWAMRLLQRLVTRMGFPAVEDGVIGPRTLAAVRAASAAAPDLIADAYGIERRNYYYRLGDRRPASRKYVRRRDGGKGGWIRRAEEFISPRFHLTGAEHRARVAPWA